MSFDREYPHRHDWRRPYRKAKAVDPSFRNHGRCPWCQRNRHHNEERRKAAANSTAAPGGD